MNVLYFVRVRHQFVATIQEKLVSNVGVSRLEEASVEGKLAKAERGVQVPGVDHALLIVRVQGNTWTEQVEQILNAGKLLDAIYQYERVEIK